MTTQAQAIEGKEYEKQYLPYGGFVFISKDLSPTSYGKLFVPDTVRGEHSRFMCTGVVIAKSPFKVLENESELYWMSKIKKGDRVGFGASVPVYSPSPPNYTFSGDDKERYITLHVKDILCVICETEEKKIEFLERF